MASHDESSEHHDLTEHPLVAASGPPDADETKRVKLIGYLGRDPEPGYWRVYFTPQLATYVRVREQDVLVSGPHPGEEGQLARSVLYVRESGSLEQITPLRRDMQAGFLGGQYVAGMRATTPGMPPSEAGGATTYVCLSLVTISVVTVTIEPLPNPPPTNPNASMASCCLCWTPEAFC
jgi:hypothetical protein